MSEGFSPLATQILAHLDDFTEAELHHLNRLIVERLRLMQQVKAHGAMIKFRIGQRVQFDSPSGVVVGVLTKYNRKSVSVRTDHGTSWTVSPTFLRPAN